MHQIGLDWHPKVLGVFFLLRQTMIGSGGASGRRKVANWAALLSPTRGLLAVGQPRGLRRGLRSSAAMRLLILELALIVAVPAMWGQDNGQGQPPANSQSAQEIPDAPSAVQPPTPKLAQPTDRAPNPAGQTPAAMPLEPGHSSSADTAQTDPDAEKPTPAAPTPPVDTVPPGSASTGDEPKNQVASNDNPYRIGVSVNFVHIPVTVKDKQGRRVE